MFISLFVPLFVIIIVTIYKLNIFLNFPPLLGAYWTDKTSLTGLTECLCVAWPGLRPRRIFSNKSETTWKRKAQIYD